MAGIGVLTQCLGSDFDSDCHLGRTQLTTPPIAVLIRFDNKLLPRLAQPRCATIAARARGDASKALLAPCFHQPLHTAKAETQRLGGLALHLTVAIAALIP